MIYVMSDVHGEYDKYLRMLEMIGFSDEDALYVLGDAVDRGPEPVRLLKDMAARDNVFFLRGNHEAMASYVLRRLNVEITVENAENHIDETLMRAIMEWQADGGDVTMRQFRALNAEEKADLLDYISEAPLYEAVDTDRGTFILTHAGLGNFRKGRRLREYTEEELTMMRPDYDRNYFGDPSVFIVTGHTPTLAVTGKAEIYRSQNNILIDCGAAFGGRLACLCLDTMEEFYVV